jgi:hypothetical protein
MNPLDDGLRDSKCAVSAPAESTAGRFDEQHAGLLLKQAPHSVLTESPPVRDLRD